MRKRRHGGERRKDREGARGTEKGVTRKGSDGGMER